ncbi:MAG TPA: thioredoxin-dependent thiol peroxidase [Candidatus Paceibacterota bacterium]|jgi:peroxiredoxin Q/BCP|nr:thioredoxin-dependent thiol peroxidase [Candidatus Paceibacterota bacterium]
MIPAPGSVAPDFTLQDQDGVAHTLSSHHGSRVLLYFYPKDDTPGCTKQACALRDAMPELSKLDAIVFGISPDSVKSHKKFAEKYGLPFILLADEGHAVADAYGVWGPKKFMGRSYDGIARTSFLIDRDGTIETVFENVKAEKHADEVLAYLSTHG